MLNSVDFVSELKPKTLTNISSGVTSACSEGNKVFVANADGSNVKQVTNFGNANWAPGFMHDGKRIIFASNHQSKRGYPFNLFTIHEDGTHLEKITAEKIFDAFAMFSPNGKKLVFCSNRNNGGTHDTNIFIADWVE